MTMMPADEPTPRESGEPEAANTPPSPEPARVMSGADLAAILERAGLRLADVAKAAGIGLRAAQRHVAMGERPLSLRNHHAYTAAIAALTGE